MTRSLLLLLSSSSWSLFLFLLGDILGARVACANVVCSAGALEGRHANEFEPAKLLMGVRKLNSRWLFYCASLRTARRPGDQPAPASAQRATGRPSFQVLGTSHFIVIQSICACSFAPDPLERAPTLAGLAESLAAPQARPRQAGPAYTNVAPGERAIFISAALAPDYGSADRRKGADLAAAASGLSWLAHRRGIARI